MQAEVISIGDELTSGQRLDTNSQWLSRVPCPRLGVGMHADCPSHQLPTILPAYAR
jgi:molybdopterin-biosynthesis enzyme MoeA-like protein